MAISPKENPVLSLELDTPLLLEAETVRGRIKSIFAGMQKDNCLMVRLPLGEGLGAKFNDGTLVTVRYLAGGQVVGFRSPVVGKYLKGPLRFLFLAYPQEVETQNLRQSARLPGYVPAQVLVEGRELEGMVTDIGKGGMRFLHRFDQEPPNPPQVAPGQSLLLRCALFGLTGPREMECLVRNFSSDGTCLQLGVEFRHLEPELREQIERYVDQVSALLEDAIP